LQSSLGTNLPDTCVYLHEPQAMWAHLCTNIQLSYVYLVYLSQRRMEHIMRSSCGRIYLLHIVL